MRPEPFVIPALPILLPLGAVLMVASWVVLRRRGTLTGRRLAAFWLASWYAVAVLGATLLPLEVDPGGAIEWFRINPVPLTMLRVRDFVLNIAMTVPLAAVLYVVFGVRDRARVLRVAVLVSASIEVTQTVLILTVHGNRWAEANDLVANVGGAWLGFLLFRRLLDVEGVRRAVDGSAAVPERTP
ncbi:VanZ family protein [Paractinoplanes rishiriensis]|nr:VanZ family protein [Actinoplanes rishiriensis]